jgi:hypothetical protein
LTYCGILIAPTGAADPAWPKEIVVKLKTEHLKNLSGLTAALGLVALATGLGTMEQGLVAIHKKEASRSLAAVFGPQANLPVSDNVAGIVQTFQTPQNLLPIAATVSQIQAQMNASVPAGTPYWDGQGPLPGSLGTADYPTFKLDTSGCSMVPVTFYDVYSPSMNLPTVWCGAISNQTQPAMASGGGVPSSASSGNSPIPALRVVQMTSGAAL